MLSQPSESSQQYLHDSDDDPFEQVEADALLLLNYIEEFDSHIDFDEKRHRYFIDGLPYRDSTTGFVHSFFSHFDPDEACRKIRNGRRWGPTHKYWGMSDNEIKASWEVNRVDASTRGTIMHELIERFFNNLVTAADLRRRAVTKNQPELLQFLNFYAREVVAKNLVPFRTELRVFDREHALAGSVDMLFVDPQQSRQDGKGKVTELIMMDWKRSKEIKHSSFRGMQCGKPPLEHVQDCNFWQYALQLNVYRWMIERNTRFRITAMFLVVCHPNQSDYQMLRAPDLQREVCAMMATRLAATAGTENCEKLSSIVETVPMS